MFRAFRLAVAPFLVLCISAQAIERPNILWLTSEDHGPHMGCYGDRFATTPNVDGLAARGLRFVRCWSNAPVCAPARTTLISGLYPPSTGAEHMRSLTVLPESFRMYPQFLRAAGYYCTNNSKEDYNLRKPGLVWDDSSNKAHWKNRSAGQPFFAIFNSTRSHESQIRTRPHRRQHDPAQVRVPAYHPDTPEVREDWAQYYDKVSEADADAGQRLRELTDAGLADDTIVFYYADHGSGMPRNKRWPYDSGLRVPLVIHFPEKWRSLAPEDYRAGGRSERLVSFVDFAPTVLSLAGVRPPEWMQGVAFAGKFVGPPRKFLHGFRGRMDERYDLVRTVTDGRFVYVRNYMPHLIYGQHVGYMFETPTTRVWKRLHDEGKLTPEQDRFWQRKPAEELYDLTTDPDEVRNLADDPAQRATLVRLRDEQRRHALAIRDVGFLPEGEIHQRAGKSSPYEMGHDPARYPLERILTAADAASSLDPSATPELVRALADEDSAVRYWGALGLLMRGEAAVRDNVAVLRAALRDASPSVRIAAAEPLVRFASEAERTAALQTLVETSAPERKDHYASIAGLFVLDNLGPRAASVLPTVRQWKFADEKGESGRTSYSPRLMQSLRQSE